MVWLGARICLRHGEKKNVHKNHVWFSKIKVNKYDVGAYYHFKKKSKTKVLYGVSLGCDVPLTLLRCLWIPAQNWMVWDGKLGVKKMGWPLKNTHFLSLQKKKDMFFVSASIYLWISVTWRKNQLVKNSGCHLPNFSRKLTGQVLLGSFVLFGSNWNPITT